MTFIKYIEDLKGFNGKILQNIPMKEYTTMKVGGNARVFVKPLDIKSLKMSIEMAKKYKLPYKVLGNGSNILVRDEGFDGVVISLSDGFSDIFVDGDKIIAGAGAIASRVSNMALSHGLSGLEFLGGIPGSLGGAVFMNAGAYGGEMAQVVTKTIFLKHGEICEITDEEHEFSYRNSLFHKNTDFVIISTEMKLKSAEKTDIEQKMKEFSAARREKQPLNFPSCGSTFKRPEGYFAGALIEESGLKGYKIGGAMVSTKHAGFVVNSGDATCEDVLNLIEYIKEQVFLKTSVLLECEVEII